MGNPTHIRFRTIVSLGSRKWLSPLCLCRRKTFVEVAANCCLRAAAPRRCLVEVIPPTSALPLLRIEPPQAYRTAVCANGCPENIKTVRCLGHLRYGMCYYFRIGMAPVAGRLLKWSTDFNWPVPSLRVPAPKSLFRERHDLLGPKCTCSFACTRKVQRTLKHPHTIPCPSPICITMLA